LDTGAIADKAAGLLGCNVKECKNYREFLVHKKKKEISGVGKLLPADAIKRTLAVSDQIAIYAMVVDAINDNVRGFYEQFGFTRLSNDSPTRN
jgi:hypothetical protein